MEWSLAGVHDVVSATVPDREMVVWQDRRPTHGEVADRTAPGLGDVDDGSGVPALEGSTPYEEAIAAGDPSTGPDPSPDDLYVVCTGGTTGSPKAVLWRQSDAYVSAMGGRVDVTADE